MKAKRQRGFTLIEAMVALTIGIILLTIMSMIFVANGSYRNDLDRSSRQIENASYALQRVTGDAMMGAYYAELDLAQAKMTVPQAAKPDPCAATLTATATADSLTKMHTTGSLASDSPLWMGIQGYEAPDNATAPTLPATCTAQGITDLMLGSDVLVVRHAEPCIAGPTPGTGCTAAVTNSGTPYFQASHCTPDGAHTGYSGTTLLGTWELQNPGNAVTANGICAPGDHSWCVMSTDTSNLILNNIDCNTGASTQADYHIYLVDIWFVTNNDQAGDGIPTLKLAQIGSGTGGVMQFNITPVAEGIETMQLEYGIDTTGNDGIPDLYTSNPDQSLNGDACPGTVLVCNQHWSNVMSVKVHLLARSTEATPVGYSNDKTFTLGLQADGATPRTFGPFNDGFKRHVYEATARVYNSAGRKQSGPTP